MIKANELRIGNWVLVAGSLIHLNDTVKLAYIFEQDGFETRCEGIPLTPEVLHACGATKGDDCEYRDLDGFKIWSSSEGETNDSGFYHINSELLLHFDYLHQLQNLYFALNGEELTINNEALTTALESVNAG